MGPDEKHDAGPVIIARFELDENGNPVFIEDEDTKHYKVQIEVENSPSDTYAATFELDPTYYDPVQTLRPNQDGHIKLATTSYGDYALKVRLRTKEGEIPLVESLTRALRRSYADVAAGSPLQKALFDIESN